MGGPGRVVVDTFDRPEVLTVVETVQILISAACQEKTSASRPTAMRPRSSVARPGWRA